MSNVGAAGSSPLPGGFRTSFQEKKNFFEKLSGGDQQAAHVSKKPGALYSPQTGQTSTTKRLVESKIKHLQQNNILTSTM
jgi:hypothetical protein